MEDLRQEGFYLGLDLNKEQVNVSMDVIDHMAKMHASCWGKEINKKFGELKKNNDKDRKCPPRERGPPPQPHNRPAS